MFLKEREETEKLLMLKVIRRRISNNNPKKALVEQDINRQSAGLWGEREVDKKLRRIDQDKYHILCDLRLTNDDGTFFQIDTLVLSTCFFLIIDSKNMLGSLHFDLVDHQFYRINNEGKVESFPDPVSQVRLHQQQLFQWLLQHKLPYANIEFLVTMTNPNSIFHIKQPDHSFAKKICSLSGLTWKIDDIAGIFIKDIITGKEVRKIARALIKAHTPLKPSDILRHYGISKNEILTGVHCPECEYLPLFYQIGKWHCPRCRKSFVDAHYTALEDYFLIYGPTLTNAQFRKFLHLADPDIATKKLKELNLEPTGTKKGRVYSRVTKIGKSVKAEIVNNSDINQFPSDKTLKESDKVPKK